MTDLPNDRRPTEAGLDSSNDSVESLLAEILQRNLQVSPELQEKRRRLLQILADEAKSEPPDDSPSAAPDSEKP